MANYPIGKYKVVLSGVQGFSETSNGNPQFFMKFTPCFFWNHQQGDWEECEQAERTWYRVLTEKSIEYAAEDLRSLGFQGAKLAELDPRHPQKHIFHGEIEMTCTMESFTDRNTGQMRTTERWNVVRHGNREEKLVEPATVKKLDMLFGAALKAVPPIPTAVAPAPAAPAARAQAAPPAPARQERSLPPQGIDPATGYANPPAAAPAALGTMEITDDDLPF
jgi:hypothetical protein